MTKKTPCNGLTFKHCRCVAGRPDESRRVRHNRAVLAGCPVICRKRCRATSPHRRHGANQAGGPVDVGVQVRETFELKQIDEEEFEE